MKKKLLSLVFALLVMIPCAFLLTACGGSDTVIVSVKDPNDSGINSIEFYDIEEFNGFFSPMYFTWNEQYKEPYYVPKGNTYLVVVSLKDSYIAGSLQLYINDELHELRPLAQQLQQAGNSDYASYEDNTSVATIFDLNGSAPSEMEISFEGGTELKRYSLQFENAVPAYDPNKDQSTIYRIANYEDLRFQVFRDSVHNDEWDQTYTLEPYDYASFSALCRQFNGGSNKLNYGDKVIFHVWFDGQKTPFNNAGLFKIKSNYADFWQDLPYVYYDGSTGKSVYMFEVDGNTELRIDWVYDNEYIDEYNYDQAYLNFEMGDKYLTKLGPLTHAEIMESGAVYTIDGFSQNEYELLMKDYTEIRVLAYTPSYLTQAQKEEIFSYDAETQTLTCNFGKKPAISYGNPYLDENNKYSMLKNFGSEDEYPNNFNLECEVDHEQMHNDQSLKTLKFNHYYYGQNAYDYNNDTLILNSGSYAGTYFFDYNNGKHYTLFDDEDLLQYCFYASLSVEGKLQITVSDGINNMVIAYDYEQRLFVCQEETITGVTVADAGGNQFFLNIDLTQNPNLQELTLNYEIV